MNEKKRKPGRPKGTQKKGEQSPKKMLDFLRTKAWAWTCAYCLSVDDETPLSAYALAQEANKISLTNNQSGNYEYDTARWSRWMRGLRGALPATVRSLWEEPQAAYFIGPWVDGQHGIPNTGGFVPLWTSLTTAKGLRNQWMGISDATWEDWAPLICDEGDPYCTAAPDLNLICQPQDVRSSTSYCNFLTRITKSKESPPLLAFAAALTLARIEGLSRILFFDPYRSDVSFDGCDPPYTLCPSFRAGLFNALKEINISFAEIARVAEGFGLKMYDCGALTFDQYSKLRWGRQSRKFALREDVTEEEWRAIFGTPLPKD